MTSALSKTRGKTEGPTNDDTASLPPDASSSSAGDVPFDAAMEIIERIAASEAFEKSHRLPPLLRYLALCTLRNDRAGLTEQAIGRAVFEKPVDFHPAEDSSVRVYVRQLRLRLHEYYWGAGRNESITVEIPKGGYALTFHARAGADVALERGGAAGIALPVPQPAASGAMPVLRRIRPMIPWLIAAVCLLLAAAGWYRSWQAVRANEPPWPFNAVVQPGQTTTLVLADVSYVLRLLGDREVTLDEYADHHYADRLIPEHATEGEMRLFSYLQSSRITSMADAHAVAAVSAVAGSQRGELVVRSAKEMNGSMLANGNFIFVGASTSNPWVDLYQGRLNFRLVEDGMHGGRYILNRSPRAGEAGSYSVTESTGHSGEDYATISLVPGTGEKGNALLLQGLRLEGTEAAVRFLSSAGSRAVMAEKLKAANAGKMPAYFEVLLHAHSVGGSAASIDCVAARAVKVRDGL
jgi:hypothetical protein